MNFYLKIKMGNDAMQTHDDLAAILIELGRYLETTGANARIGEIGTTRDLNGNRVGDWKITR